MIENGITETCSRSDFGRLAAKIASSYVRHNNVPASDLPNLIESTADALINLLAPDEPIALPASRRSSAQIRASITSEALISFEDGKGYKTLKRHLTAVGLTPETYRAKWGLPTDYPMVAPAYGIKRSAIAKGLMLNRYGREKPTL